MRQGTLPETPKAFHLPFEESLGISRLMASLILVGLGLLLAAGVLWFVQSAPPKKLTMATGPTNSSYYRLGERYKEILGKNGIKLTLVVSGGGLDNFGLLTNKTQKVDIGFVQSGSSEASNGAPLMSLGSVNYQPLYIFYRGDEVTLFKDFANKRIAVGEKGSGARILSKLILSNNGLGKTNSFQYSLDSEKAAEGLIAGDIDVAFMMGDSVSYALTRKLMQSPGVRVFDFAQAETYSRRYPYLTHLNMPVGSFDLQRNLPEREFQMISPTVDLIARKNMHPALVDLILDAATQIHSRPTTLRKKGEFPNPKETEIALSPDAARYYKTGKSFLYRYMPFWIASMLSRLLVVVVPLLVVVVPGLRVLPVLFSLGMKLNIYRWYRGLLAIEQDLKSGLPAAGASGLLQKLDDIEADVSKKKIPTSFANTIYVLKGHIRFVRERLENISKGIGPLTAH